MVTVTTTVSLCRKMKRQMCRLHYIWHFLIYNLQLIKLIRNYISLDLNILSCPEQR